MRQSFPPGRSRALLFLSVATFFEGFDFFALTQILPDIRAEFHLDKFDAGLLFAFVNFGTVVAWALIRRADRWGRRRVLQLSIVGYTFCSLLSGFAWNVWSLALFQFAARIFLVAEWATSMVYASEEFPQHRRGTAIGIIQATSSLGAIACAAVTPLLLNTSFGWRAVYFVGFVPLAILFFARRNLRETARFSQLAPTQDTPRGLLDTLRGPHRQRILQLALIWGLTYACSNTAISFWKDFAVHERGLENAQVATSLSVAAILSLPFIFFAGRLLDAWGRKGGAAVVFTSAALGVFFSYTAQSHLALTLALAVAIFGVNSVLPVLNTFTTELFPTSERAEAFAWSNNLLGRLGYVLSPVVIGGVAARWGWGAAIAPTALLLLLALALILWLLPETSQLDVDELARVEGRV